MLPTGKLREDCPLGIVDELSIIHAISISYHTGFTRRRRTHLIHQTAI